MSNAGDAIGIHKIKDLVDRLPEAWALTSLCKSPIQRNWKPSIEKPKTVDGVSEMESYRMLNIALLQIALFL